MPGNGHDCYGQSGQYEEPYGCFGCDKHGYFGLSLCVLRWGKLCLASLYWCLALLVLANNNLPKLLRILQTVTHSGNPFMNAENLSTMRQDLQVI